MVETIGKQLLRARQARGLSLEEAALETRIRASQLAALEADDYSTFGNNTYARGFLQIYGKFLRVDVGMVTRELESGNPISVGDYQYLNAVAEEEPKREQPRTRSVSRREPERRRPSLVPLIVFIVLLGVVGLGAHFYIQAQRLDTTPANQGTAGASVGEGAGNASSTPSLVSAASAKTGGSAPAPTPGPATSRQNPTDRPFLAAPATPAPVLPSPPVPGTAQSGTPLPLPGINELIVEPLKKTWVRIRRDDPSAEPIYDDILYPKVGLLKLRGSRFWVESREPNALALRKNGQSVAVPPPGEAIQ
jgi:cytoskeletal protein RodZ